VKSAAFAVFTFFLDGCRRGNLRERVRSRSLCSLLEFLEPSRQPVAVRPILTPSRRLDHLPDDPLEAEFEKRIVANFEQPVRDANVEIRVDSDQLGVKSGVMDLR
jgi:hypothetical protein